MKRLRFKKLRLWAGYPLYAWGTAYGYVHGFRFNPGIWFIAAGMFVRLWAAGHITKRAKLATAGPYAYVRNPLYVGNFLMGLGFCMFCHNVLFVGSYILLFAFMYWGTVTDEQKMLTERFGNVYLRYVAAVPAYVPRLRPYAEAVVEKYSIKQLINNGEFIRVLVTALLIMFIFYFEYALRCNRLDAQAQKIFWVVAGLCGIVLAAVIVHRRGLVHGKNS